MKILSLSLVSLLCGSAAFAQSSTVATNPVGFISITVNGGSAASPALTLISPTLTNPIAYQSTVASVSGATITINGASFTTNEFNGSNGEFYVEDISTSQGGVGVLDDITATGTNSVTTAQNISAMVSVGDTIIIRQHITINQFLGANNTYGLLGSNSDATQSDDVLVFDGSSQITYWYYTGTPPSLSDAGWYDLAFNPAGTATIEPFQGVMIRRRTAGNVTITSTGTVKPGNTYFPVASGFNILGTLSAQGLTLGTSGLVTSGLVGSNSDATTSDQVITYTNGTPTTYWYYTGTPPSLSDAGWYDLAFDPAGTVALSPGESVILKRNEGAAFNWNQPAPSSF